MFQLFRFDDRHVVNESLQLRYDRKEIFFAPIRFNLILTAIIKAPPNSFTQDSMISKT